MILAEELDADFAQVALLHAPPNDKLYGNPTFGLQVTGNSNSIRAFWKPLRNAGASARAMLVQAAAKQWQVDAASCTASKSEVTHTESGRKLAYGALAMRREQRGAAEGCAAEGPEGLRLYRAAAEAARYAGQGQRQGRLRHRRDPAGHEVRNGCRLPRVRRQGRQGRRQRGEEDSRRAQDRGARRHGRRDRRSHVGGQERPGRAQDRLGRRAERQDQFERHLAAPARGQRKGRRRRQVGRRHRQGACDGRKVRGGLRAAVPRARGDGAAERHRSCQAGCLRDLDRHADREPGAVGSGQGGGIAGREGDRQQPPARRRLRPQARAGHGGRGGARRQAGRTIR